MAEANVAPTVAQAPEVVAEALAVVAPLRQKRTPRGVGDFVGREKDYPHLLLTDEQRRQLPHVMYDREGMHAARRAPDMRAARYEPLSGVWEDLLPESLRPDCAPLKERWSNIPEQRPLFANHPDFTEKSRSFAQECLDYGVREGKQGLMALLWGELDLNLHSRAVGSRLLTIPVQPPTSKPRAKAGVRVTRSHR
jgi:hypothetical protein